MKCNKFKKKERQQQQQYIVQLTRENEDTFEGMDSNK